MCCTGAGKGTYRAHVRHMVCYHGYKPVSIATVSMVSQGANQWYELQDLHVQDLLPQMITLAEAYIQVGVALNIT